MGEVQPITADMPLHVLIIVSAIAFVLSVMLLWWAALIVHVREANFVKSLLGALGMSFAVLAFSTALNYLPEDSQQYYLILVGAMVLLQVFVLRLVFQTSLWKAAGMWLLNVMMILIVYSLFIMAVVGRGEVSTGQSSLRFWRPV